MPFVEHRQRLYRLREGENRLGTGSEASIRIPGLPEGCVLAISVERVGSVASANGGPTEVAINGRSLGRGHVPLFHGDHLSMNGTTLLFIDDGGEPTNPMRDLAPVHVAENRLEPQARTIGMENELLMRMTPPQQPRPKTVAVLRRLDTNEICVVHGNDFKIGREKRCDLIIPDRCVSRLHAEINYVGDRHLLHDLGRAGTHVNGKKVREPYTLQIGDVIKIAAYEFAFSRRPAGAEEFARPKEVTPVRSAVPDAPTVQHTGPGGSRVLPWLLFLASAGTVVLILLT